MIENDGVRIGFENKSTKDILDIITFVEEPSKQFRWLKKKNGKKVLQQLWLVHYTGSLRYDKYEWREIKEVDEEDDKSRAALL